MKDLQHVIDVTLQSASPLTRRVYANHQWSATTVQRFVNKVMAATVATVRADGRPHAAWVLTACLDGTIYFTASTGSLLLRNLERRSAISMTVADREHDLTIHGHVERLGRASELPDLVKALHALSRRGQFIPRQWNGWLYAVHIDRIYLSR